MRARIPQGAGNTTQNMNNMIRQAQKMQNQITELQDDIEAREFPVTVGGGVVKLVMSGKKTITSLQIDPEVVDPGDVETLQDLIISAVNEAVTQIEQTTEDEMSVITGGVSLPGLF